MRKIILLGYMGCGKSTIAKKLSKDSGIAFIDLDEYIEKKANLSINTIFEKHGEIYFRKLEHQLFVELLHSPEEIIIGLGGGTPCYANNHTLLIGECHMDNKLPKVYVNNQNNKIDNNKETFYGKSKNVNYNYNNSKNANNEIIIKKKINEIFANPKFIYKIKVAIKTDEWEREVVLIAKTNTSVLTIENQVIPISIIRDISIIN